jgi:hypothetical protein
VLDRESTFADETIVDLLKTRYIPVAIDQWYTRRQQDREGAFYRKIAGQGPRSDFDKTTQGLYIADPAGALIAYNNNRGPERIRALLEKAIVDYTPPAATPLPRDSVDARYHAALPDGAIVLRCSAKILGGYQSTGDPWQKIFQTAVSRDNLWITADEQRQLLNDEVPQSLAQRVALFHLVDNTRGEPPTWKPHEIRQLDWSIVDGRLAGEARLETDDHQRSYEATLTGVIKSSGDRITRFDIYVEGPFAGRGTFTGQPPAGKFPLAIAFQLADGSDIADSIPPHASRGWLEGYLQPQLLAPSR